MNTMSDQGRSAMLAILLALIGAFSFASLPEAAELPTTSVYRLDVPLVDQDGNGLHLADRRGKPLIVSMFYTSCHNVCPLTIDTLLATERALAPNARLGLDVLLVSFDSERDDPLALKRVADLRKLDVPRWTLARTEAANVRKLSAVLGIQYRELANREFNHSSALVLLDAEGRMVARSDTVGAVDQKFVSALATLLSGK